ncbi:type ISP restriction/modification enzyme [Myxacorys almedinensis]|uniref:Type ISP restriction-modification enzyme LLaBIII C-terminal specificity domain-containing protein n=1 Tax=Myxacorys almedinensis A TaxID=2690445 RepID=A0A8J8CHS0_9CYAN|nr:type ISP restriction/modification enzyme [Myxacorys almedinensis]NDJ16998.1 hypothetical protein [Myxacorys almedinensis A]
MTKFYHTDLWGSREDKDRYLQEHDITTVEWTEIFPKSPLYLFAPQDQDLRLEYDPGWQINKIFPINTLGFQSHRDDFAIAYSQEQLQQRLQEFRDTRFSDEEIRSKYALKDNRDWSLTKARQRIRQIQDWKRWLIKFFYRPFDLRSCYFSTIAMDYPRVIFQQHFTEENIFLNVVRQTKADDWRHAFVANTPTPALYVELKDGSNAFPLYLYPDIANQQSQLFVEKSPNLSSDFITAIREKLGYVPTPEAIFYYIYAIFHSPTYRDRYAKFLKSDFPRVPLTSSDHLFKDLGTKGQALVELHLMKSKKLNKLITKMGGNGDNAVTEVTYKPTEQRVYINGDRYFEGIAPEVWEFKIGGYQVLDKWLKDRKKAKRTLSFDDVLHYQKVVVALKETRQIMQEIDQLIPGFPIE